MAAFPQSKEYKKDRLPGVITIRKRWGTPGYTLSYDSLITPQQFDQLFVSPTLEYNPQTNPGREPFLAMAVSVMQREVAFYSGDTMQRTFASAENIIDIFSSTISPQQDSPPVSIAEALKHFAQNLYALDSIEYNLTVQNQGIKGHKKKIALAKQILSTKKYDKNRYGLLLNYLTNYEAFFAEAAKAIWNSLILTQRTMKEKPTRFRSERLTIMKAETPINCIIKRTMKINQSEDALSQVVSMTEYASKEISTAGLKRQAPPTGTVRPAPKVANFEPAAPKRASVQTNRYASKNADRHHPYHK